MKLSSKTKYEKLEVKKRAQQEKLNALQEQLTELEQRIKDALVDGGDYTAIMKQKSNIDKEIQTVKESLEFISRAMAEAEAEHLRIKLAEIKKERSQINSKIEPLQKAYDEAKKAYIKAEAALATARYKAIDEWQRLSKMESELRYRLRSIERQQKPDNNSELLTARL